MQAFSPLYSVLSLCNFGLSHVGHQTTIFFSLSLNFVYSVIINQPHCMTALWAQTDTKDMRGRWKQKERGRREEDVRGNVTEIVSFLNFRGGAETNWVCASLVCRYVCTFLYTV